MWEATLKLNKIIEQISYILVEMSNKCIINTFNLKGRFSPIMNIWNKPLLNDTILQCLNQISAHQNEVGTIIPCKTYISPDSFEIETLNVSASFIKIF